MAIRSFFAESSEGGLHPVDAGTVVARDDPAVEAHPAAFAEVVPPGLARRDALVATTTMRSEGGEGVTTVYQGQWVSRDHPFVRVHPHHFAYPPSEYV